MWLICRSQKTDKKGETKRIPVPAKAEHKKRKDGYSFR